MSDLQFRYAEDDDLTAIVALLADDEFGEAREQSGGAVCADYEQAFKDMSQSPGNRILLAEQDGKIVGALQLVFIPGLSRRGVKRALIEAVRVASDTRGAGIGSALMRHAIEEAKQAGCKLVQLTSDVRRKRAHLFYRRLGFEQSHIGFKREL